MPFKSKKQKRTIDAAAHNPAFAKKIGIDVADAKRMSAHGKGQTKFKEAIDTVEKDEQGNVKSWKHEGDWVKAKGKEGRGKVTNLSDKARRKTEKMSKAEESMLKNFEDFIINEADFVDPRYAPKPIKNSAQKVIDMTADHPQNWKPITSKDMDEYSRRLQWYRDNQPDAFNTMQPNDMVKWQRMKGEKDVILPAPMDPVYPAPKQQRPIKKSDAADVLDQPTQVALGGEEEMPNVAEAAYSAKAGRAGKDLGKKGKNFSKIAKSAGGGKKGNAIAGKVLKDIRAKHLKESIEAIQQMIAEAKKKEMKCSECGMWESKCSCDHTNEGYTINGKKVTKKAYDAEMKKAGKKVKEGNDGNLANNAKPYDKVTRGDVIAGRLGKDEMGGKKKTKKTTEALGTMANQKAATKFNQSNIAKMDREEKARKAAEKKKKDEKTTEGNDGNLANNAKPYDKVTRGDVIAGRLGKDEMGGKKKKVKESYSREELSRRIFETDGEYDDEAGMADNNLETLKRAVMGLDSEISPGDNLPEWCQEKIAIARESLISVWDYIQSNKLADRETEVPSDDEYMESLRESLERFKRQ